VTTEVGALYGRLICGCAKFFSYAACAAQALFASE